MPTELTFQLGGDITLDDFAEGVRRFKEIVDELSREVARDVQWVITNLEHGSALVTVTGESSDPVAVETVGRSYTDSVSKWSRGEPIENRKVASSLQSLSHLLRNGVESIRFSTEEQDIQIVGSSMVIEEAPSAESYDLLEGRVRMITDRGGLKFTLYDSIYDVGVTCHLKPGQEELMRELWGHKTVIEGLVRRDADTGRPRQVRDIVLVERVEESAENPYSFEDARGLFPWTPGEPLPEEVLRKIRNAG